MNSVVESVTFLQQFFPGGSDPIKFLDTDCDQDTIGSESLTSFDTAEQSLVSRSEVFHRASLSVTDQNPERLALAVEVSPNKNNPDTDPATLDKNINNHSVLDRVNNTEPLELKIYPGLPILITRLVCLNLIDLTNRAIGLLRRKRLKF